MFVRVACAFVAAFAPSALVSGAVVSDYTVGSGGSNFEGPSGLSARAAFELSGTTLWILLENTSTGVPASADVSNSLLVSLGFNLPESITITSGDSAVIGPGSRGLGAWSDRGPGDSVAEQWLWTNGGGGDLMEAFAQVISTSQGQGRGTTTSFRGEANPQVSGPFGGIAADPVLRAIPASKPAVSDSILFTLTLSDLLSEFDLAYVARNAIIEYGSDFQYLVAPAPSGLALLLLPLAIAGRRRR